MNREEILKKSRSENIDEGLAAAQQRGNRVGITAFCIVFIFITIFNLLTGGSNYAPQAMFWAFIAAEAYPKYKFTGHRVILATTVLGAFCSAAFLACFIIEALR